ncbi:CD63 antigen-like isoform X1 [Neodiprion fabricii]|uniref:CD63 antigen-like isoform X1 n=1 Tax=Neodiprion fabricii TaxID=2872261 RepID=UPI001ED9424A|nr:CD63 antigen-like isoform X1 [Neodiprion fabricii]
MSCGISCIKYLLFIFNFVFVLVGLVLLGFGVWIHLELDDYQKISETVGAPAIALIILGSIIFVIAFFGCCGTIRENHCMVVTFAVFLLAILIIQIAIGVWAFLIYKDVGTDEWTQDIATTYKDLFAKYWSSENDQAVIDVVQSNLNCCGIASSEDYTNRSYFTNSTAIPWSCCGNAENVNCASSSSVYQKGCLDSMEEFFGSFAKIIGGIAIGVAATELVGIIFALCLANSIRNDDRRGYRV